MHCLSTCRPAALAKPLRPGTAPRQGCRRRGARRSGCLRLGSPQKDLRQPPQLRCRRALQLSPTPLTGDISQENGSAGRVDVGRAPDRACLPRASGGSLRSGSSRATTEDSAHPRHHARPKRSVRIVPAIAPPDLDSGRATRASRGSARTAAGVGGPLRRRRGACPCRAFRGDP